MNTVYLFLIAALMALLNVSFALSQNTAGEYDKLEGSVGFSHQRAGDTSGFDDSPGFNGFDASVTKNLTRYFGIKGAFSGAYRSDGFSVPGILPGSIRRFAIKTSIYTYLGGIQIKDNTKTKRLKPFFHALAGGGTLTQKLTGDCPNDVASICAGYSYSTTGFAAAVGGGLDIRVSKRISIRAVQADYNPIFIDGETLNNFRVGVGIVFH
jgi:hypothetical protein